MITIEQFGLNSFAHVLRDGNNKIAFFYGGDIMCVIEGRVAFLKYDGVDNHSPLVIQTFLNIYSWAYDTVKTNREFVESVTI